MHPRTKGSKNLQKLRDGPKKAKKVNIPEGIRQNVGKLSVAKSQGSAKSRDGNIEMIYYLIGDERRAVRKFIEINQEFVDDCMEDKCSPISKQLGNFLYALIEEEYEIMKYNGEI